MARKSQVTSHTRRRRRSSLLHPLDVAPPDESGLPEHASLARRLLEDAQRDGRSSARRRLMLVPVSGETSPLPAEVSPALTSSLGNPSGNTHQEPRIIEGASRTPQRASGASEEKIDHAHGHCRGAAEASGGVRDAPGPKVTQPVFPKTTPSLTRRSIGRGRPAASHTVPRARRPSDRLYGGPVRVHVHAGRSVRPDPRRQAAFRSHGPGRLDRPEHAGARPVRHRAVPETCHAPVRRWARQRPSLR